MERRCAPESRLGLKREINFTYTILRLFLVLIFLRRPPSVTCIAAKEAGIVGMSRLISVGSHL